MRLRVRRRCPARRRGPTRELEIEIESAGQPGAIFDDPIDDADQDRPEQTSTMLAPRADTRPGAPVMLQSDRGGSGASPRPYAAMSGRAVYLGR